MWLIFGQKYSSTRHFENKFCFAATSGPYNGHEDPILRRYNFFHSLGFGKMHPTKLDIMDIQTEVSSQLDSNLANLTIQSDISSKITNICTKNTTSERCKVVWLKSFRADSPLLFFNIRFCFILMHIGCIFSVSKYNVVNFWVKYSSTGNFEN